MLWIGSANQALGSYPPVPTQAIKSFKSLIGSVASSGAAVVFSNVPSGCLTQTGSEPSPELLEIQKSANESSGRLDHWLERFRSENPGIAGNSGDTIPNSPAQKEISMMSPDFSSGATTYTYDDLNRLTSATTPPEAFTYDPVGNQNPITQLYDFANRLLEDGTFTYTYDANGNLITKQDKTTLETTAFSYDAENQLVRIDFPDLTSATYAYDGLGRRIQKDVDGVVTKYIYDNEDILEEYDASNTLKARWVHGSGIDEPLVMERDLDLDGSLETVLFSLQDGLGSVIGLVDFFGNVLERYTYTSFGKPTITSPGPDGVFDPPGTDPGLTDDETLTESAFGNPYLFTGREFDPETGLYYYRARYYDPNTGRFLQEDPGTSSLRFPQTLNKYPYVLDNPINLTDPTGEAVLPLIGAGLRGAITFCARFPNVCKAIGAIFVVTVEEITESQLPPSPVDFVEFVCSNIGGPIVRKLKGIPRGD